jgi:predicted nucleic acid-binding protein
VKKIFIDTGAFLAKEITNDQHHSEAVNFWHTLVENRVTLYSSEHVLDEAMTLLARRTNYSWAALWGQEALASGISWLRAEEKDWAGAMRNMQKFADQGVSFTDCVSFVLMRRQGLRDVFGFDRHFSAAGFRMRNS